MPDHESRPKEKFIHPLFQALAANGAASPHGLAVTLKLKRAARRRSSHDRTQQLVGPTEFSTSQARLRSPSAKTGSRDRSRKQKKTQKGRVTAGRTGTSARPACLPALFPSSELSVSAYVSLPASAKAISVCPRGAPAASSSSNAANSTPSGSISTRQSSTSAWLAPW